jgi:hypothetical protein
MLLSRVVALKYLKDELYSHFYTEMNLNVAVVLTALLLGCCSLAGRGWACEWEVWAGMGAWAGVGACIWAEGREKMEVRMDFKSTEELS